MDTEELAEEQLYSFIEEVDSRSTESLTNENRNNSVLLKHCRVCLETLKKYAISNSSLEADVKRFEWLIKKLELEIQQIEVILITRNVKFE